MAITKVATPPKTTAAAVTTADGGSGDRRIEFSRSLVVLSDPNGVQAEAIRAVRTHVMAQHINRGRRALAICAPSRGVGCTFTATNLAVALSRIGVRTLLIDGDLREPGVHQLIRPRQGYTGGLAHCLEAVDSSFADQIDAEVVPGLSIIYAGKGALDPQELLASDRFKALIEFCLREFDVTIIDTPPSNISSDARQVSSVVGYSLIVTGRDQTFIEDVKTLAGQLEGVHAKVIGTVLNKA